MISTSSAEVPGKYLSPPAALAADGRPPREQVDRSGEHFFQVCVLLPAFFLLFTLPSRGSVSHGRMPESTPPSRPLSGSFSVSLWAFIHGAAVATLTCRECLTGAPLSIGPSDRPTDRVADRVTERQPAGGCK